MSALGRLSGKAGPSGRLSGKPGPSGRLSGKHEIDTRDLRVAGALMLGAAAVQPAWAWTGGVPCPLRTFTGVPCPLCGMTTSVCATVTGHLGDAAAANPFGILAVVVAVWLLATWRRDRALRLPRWLPWVGLAASWAWQLARFA